MEVAEGIGKQLEASLTGIENQMHNLVQNGSVTYLNIHAMDTPLQVTVSEYDLISQIYVMDTSGQQIYKTSGELGDRSTRQYFIDAVAGELNYSDVIISGSTGTPIIVVALPIVRDDEIVGVMGASIDLSLLSAYVHHDQLGEGGYIFIVDRNGRTIAHPNEELVAEMLDATFLEPVQKVITGENGIISYTYEGNTKLAAYVNFERLGWGIVAQAVEEVALKSVASQRTMFIAGVLFSAVLGLILSNLISNYITKPLESLKVNMEESASGNFSTNISTKLVSRSDEIGVLGSSYQTTIESIRTIIKDIQQTTEETTEASHHIIALSNQMAIVSDEIALTVGEIAEGATVQADRTSQGLETTLQLATTVSEMNEKSDSFKTETQNMNNNNTTVSQAFEEVVSAFDATAEATSDTSKQMNQLTIKSEDIKNIVTAIRNISEQTNLLALNASIEAARAGEHGRGFSVVANEIKKLAEQSQESTNEIQTIINDITQLINHTNDMMTNNSTTIENAGQSMKEAQSKIVEMATSAGSMMHEMTALNQDILSVDELKSSVLEAIEAIAGIAQESAASTEEISASTEEQAASVQNVVSSMGQLNESINHLKESVEIFKV
jgi:methyl-accepting chemotaxis protein